MTQPEALSRLKSLIYKQEAVKAVAAFMTARVEMDVYPVFSEVVQVVAQALDAPMVCLHLVDEDNGRLNLLEQQGLDPVRQGAWRQLHLRGSAPPSRAFSQDSPLDLTGADAGHGLSRVVCTPVRGAEIPVGTLSALWPTKADSPPDDDRITFLETMGYFLGLAIEHAGLVSELVDNLNQVMQLKAEAETKSKELASVNQALQTANLRLEELSVTDGLTGVFNHRKLHESLAEEISLARRLGHPLSLAMADLDHFKRLNDSLGHQAGDEALRMFAEWLQESVREVDVVGRYGGEEFLILLVNCNLADGLAVAEKLRDRVETNSKLGLFQDLGGFTVSMGVAQLGEDMDADALVAAADSALYRAKENGRNRIEAAA